MYDLGVFPFRIELVGAWVDHPFISEVLPGSVVTINVVNNFKSKSGLASSSGWHLVVEMWQKNFGRQVSL